MEDLDFEEYERRYESAYVYEVMERAPTEGMTLELYDELLDDVKADIARGRPIREAMWEAGKAARGFANKCIVACIQQGVRDKLLDKSLNGSELLPAEIQVSVQPKWGSSYSVPTSTIDYSATAEFPHPRAKAVGSKPITFAIDLLPGTTKDLIDSMQLPMVGACPGCNGTGVHTSPVCPSLDLYSHSQCMICEGK